jgi:hypothetical protein
MMPQRVEVDEARQAVVCRSWGEVTRSDLDASRGEILRLERERSLKHVLVDATGETDLPVLLQLYEFGEEVARSFDARVRFAMVVRPATARDRDFLATVAANRGALVRVYDDFEPAWRYLGAAPSD